MNVQMCVHTWLVDCFPLSYLLGPCQPILGYKVLGFGKQIRAAGRSRPERHGGIRVEAARPLGIA